MNAHDLINAARQRHPDLGMYVRLAGDRQQPNPEFVAVAAQALVRCLGTSNAPENLTRVNWSTMTQVTQAVRVLARLDRFDDRLVLADLMAAYLGLGFGYGEDLVRGYIDPCLLDLTRELSRAEEMAMLRHRKYRLKHYRVEGARVVSALPPPT